MNPDAVEICDDRDNDCDGTWDADTPDEFLNEYYRDEDGDGFGDPDRPYRNCTLPVGFSEDDNDCDDHDAAIHPGAPEECDGEIDSNCNGMSDEGMTSGYVDTDGDGYGVGPLVESCSGGLADDDGDCEPTDPSRNPGATEICDEIDNNCNGLIDEEEVVDCCPATSCLRVGRTCVDSDTVRDCSLGDICFEEELIDCGASQYCDDVIGECQDCPATACTFEGQTFCSDTSTTVVCEATSSGCLIGRTTAPRR